MNKIILITLISILSFGKAFAQPEATHSTGTVSAGIESEYSFSQYIANYICVQFILTEKMNVNITLNGSPSTVMFFVKSPFSATPSNANINKTLNAGEYYYYALNTNSIGLVTKFTFSPLTSGGTNNGETTPIYPTSKNYIKKSSPIIAKSTISYNPSEELIEIGYFDGLGRPVESVMQGLNPDKDDIATINGYDDLGQEVNTWLPVVLKSNNGNYADISKIKTGANLVYSGETAPFSKNLYEISPLSRVTQQYGPGADWHNNKKAVHTGYLTNKAKSGTAWTDADSLVCGKYISIGAKNNISIYRTGNYLENELYVTRIKDENDNVSYEFKNKLGQVLLMRQINAGKFYDTNYIYDLSGNLRAVFPPEASDKLVYASTAPPWTEGTSSDMMLWAYLYKYDSRDRCISKKLPGCDWVHYVYDKTDRLIFTQDGEQRKSSLWSFSIPDAFGRVVLAGTCKNTLNYAADPLKNIAVKATWVKATNANKGYTITGVTLTTPTILSASYYDNYEFMGLNNIPANTDANFKYTAEAGYGIWYGIDYTDANKAKNKGLLTGTLTAQMNYAGGVDGTYLYSVMYYDNRGRLIQAKSNNQLGGIEKEYIAYNFTGQPTLKKHIHSATGKTAQTEVYAYTYDHAGRLTKETHQLNGGVIAILAENTYDELGRLKTNKKGSLASTNATFAYNIRSWTKSITSSLFTQTLYYNETYGSSAKQYNGNIAAMNWKVTGETDTRGYAFAYDNLSRLTAANYLLNGTANTNYKTAYSYDKHGNMKTLQRYGKTSASAFGLIDNLTMTYTGNQMTKAEDAIANISLAESADFKNYSNVATEYTYNANGAMNKDLNKGISDIQYNSLNLPRQMDIKSSVAEARNEYTYSAGGLKLKTVQKWNPSYSTSPVIGSAINTATLTQTKTTDYVGNLVYENGVLKRILVDGAYIEGTTYHYYITDHLGNNRVVVNSGGTVIQKNHYYPFGTAFADTPIAEQGKQPYKYNGKELDQMHGLNLYDYSARYYESAVGRFTSVDPLAEKHYNISPYAYCLNNPLKYIDPLGMDTINVSYGGNIVYKTGGDNDILNVTDKDGNITTKTYDLKTISYRQGKSGDKTYDVLEINGDKIGTEVFELLAKNAGKVEWGHLKTGNDENGKNIILTSQGVKSVDGFMDESLSVLYSGSRLRTANHSHGMPPGDTHFPSGLPGSNEKYGDIYVSRELSLRSATTIEFNIYIPNKNLYIPFNPDSKKDDFKKYHNPKLPFGGLY